ncbi:hypothetical protein [Phyllobacterium sp. YR531]|uniref:hypothetical protein n=1 Tax=Phyllobacterium sp. YR531 TaxID=1144343 RepID=UPI00026F6C63|nr:hypothetical protein [Phyllobacterium sp. YR531]EJN05147.1 hypothetical protein PMI41_00928 [Phyllobacterium sp. YR531]
MISLRFFIVLLVSSTAFQGGALAADNSVTLTKPQRFGAAISGKILSPSKIPAKRTAVPITPETVLNAVDDRIRALFDRAADPVTHLVTVASADRAGVGYFIDNFSQIDKDQDGSLRFSEVKGFLEPQLPIERPVSQEIQIIE